MSMASSSASEDIEYYEIETILKRRVRRGKIQFLIKWKSYPEEFNSWEPKENLTQAALDDWDARHKPRSRKRSNPLSSQENSTAKTRDTMVPNLAEFPQLPQSQHSHDWIPEKIIRATMICGQIVFQVKWQGTDVKTIVSSAEAGAKWPQMVIEFYEQLITFSGQRESVSDR